MVTDDSGLIKFDTTVPNIARVYDYWLGGKDNFAADRELAERLLTIYPPVATMARDNRNFIARAVTWAAERGISRFIDLGSGLPTSPNVHETAMAVIPEARVVYVDNDPVVVSHAQALLASGEDGVTVVAADARDPDRVLAAPELAGLLGDGPGRQPAVLIMAQLLHFLDPASARELVAGYASRLAPGSYLIITVGRGDGEVADRFFGAYNAARLYNHSAADFGSFFGDLELVPPGLCEAAAWRPGWERVPALPKRPGQVLAGVAIAG